MTTARRSCPACSKTWQEEILDAVRDLVHSASRQLGVQAAENPALAHVSIWLVSLDALSDRVELSAVLTSDERRRAERFRVERDRRRFIASRAAVRVLIACGLGIEIEQVEIGYGTHGKPRLMVPDPELHFNVSHSDGLGLVAFARGRELGIDIERIRPLNGDLERMAGVAFSDAERAALMALPESERLTAFFNGWTRKEAYVKARGEGLSRPLDEFDVTLAPGEPARLVRVKDDPGEVRRWSLSALEPPAGYAGAICVERISQVSDEPRDGGHGAPGGGLRPTTA